LGLAATDGATQCTTRRPDNPAFAVSGVLESAGFKVSRPFEPGTARVGHDTFAGH